MALKRVGLPVVVIVVAVLLTAAAGRLLPGVASAALDGQVTLSAPLQFPVAIRGIAPGDSGTTEALRVRYAGSAPAWIGLDADLLGPLAEGDHLLSATISSGGREYRSRGENQVLGLYAPGAMLTLSVDYLLPRAAGNDYQAKDANLMLQLHAVEAANNTRFENGRAVGPMTWNSLEAANQTVVGQTQPDPSGGSALALVPGVAPAVSEPLLTQGMGAELAGVLPGAIVPQGAGACCLCTQSMLWIGLLYALLLVLAMLASFYLGWRLRSRGCRRRVRLRRGPILTPKERPVK